MPGLVVDGRTVTAPASRPALSWRIRGSWEATWRMLPGDHGIGPRSTVEWWAHGACIWSGMVLDPDPIEGAYTATGWCREADKWPSVTNTPDGLTPVGAYGGATWAIAQGIGWTRSTLPAVSVTTSLDLPTLAATLDDLAAEQEAWWRVTPDGVVRLIDVETTPRWLLPVDQRLGSTGEGWPTRILLHYKSSTTATDWLMAARDTVTLERYGSTWTLVDKTSRGSISPTTATTLAEKLLRQQPTPPLAPALDLAGLRHIGGVPADPTAAQPGHVVRLQGITDGTRAARDHVDVVLSTVRHGDDGTVTADTLGRPPRSVRAVVEALAATA